jgi:hypothetical protein
LTVSVSLIGITYLKGCGSETISKPITVFVNDTLKKPLSSFKDTIVTIAAGEHYSKGNFHNLFFGKHYRDLWALPVEIKIFDIEKESGGLTINKKGGGFQTLSIRLTDAENKKYVLRSIDKDQSYALPLGLRKTFISRIFTDQTSALNPYAALVIPALSQTAGLYHTNPRLYFIPYDQRFDPIAKKLEGTVAIFEEYPDSSWAHTPQFGFADDIESTEHLLKKRFSDQQVKVDSRMLAKARLFDLWIGDWDRHVDQWRWAEYKKDKIHLFKPIARDRDMAFCKFSESGIFSSMSSLVNPKLQTFGYHIGNIKGLIKNARYIDHLFLNDLDKESFLEITDSLIKNMSDSVIEKAIASWPAPVYEKIGPEIIAKLKSRRNDLAKAAILYYEEISKEVILVGTDQEERIEIERMNDYKTSVKMYDSQNEIMYARVFDNNVTGIISIYSLKGNDRISITGKVRKSIDIEIYGGDGNDIISDKSEVNGLRKRTKIFDTIDGNTIEFGKESEDKTSANPGILDFDRSGKRKKESN